MVLLLGATGFIGQAFARELRRRGSCFIPLSRSAFDYTRFDLLFDYVRRIRPTIIINAAGYAGRPGIDACEVERMQTFQANTLLAQTVARVCSITKTPLGHVSNGCIYTGAKVFIDGRLRVEPDLTVAVLRRLFETQPELFFGFTELDEANFTFRNAPCSFLAGTKALAEESLRNEPQTYIWRHRLPFNEADAPCNFLSRVQAYARVHDHVTSLSHVDDFAGACVELVQSGAAYGTYNVVNTGATTTRAIAEMIRRKFKSGRRDQSWNNDTDFYPEGARAPRSACILDNGKLLRAGVRMRSLNDALADALERWTPAEGVPVAGGRLRGGIAAAAQ